MIEKVNASLRRYPIIIFILLTFLISFVINPIVVGFNVAQCVSAGEDTVR